MSLNFFLKSFHLALGLLLRNSDKFLKLNKIFFVFRALGNSLLHFVEGMRDELDASRAPAVDTLAKLELNGVGLLGKSLLEVSSLDLEDWEIDSVVRDVQNLVLMLVELVDLLGNLLIVGLRFFLGLLIDPLEEVPGQSLLIYVHDILVLFVLVKKFVGGDHVLLEHLLNFGFSVLDPNEIRAELKARLIWKVKEGNKILLKA